MKKTFKILGKIILFIILLLILAYLIIGFFVLPHIIKKTVPEKISNEKAALSVEKASFNPLTLNLKIKNIRLENKEKISEADNIKIQELKIKEENKLDKNASNVLELKQGDKSQDFSLQNKENSTEFDSSVNFTDIFTLEEFSAKLSPWALFKKTIKVEKINIVKPLINLYKDSQGKLNIENLLSEAEVNDEKKGEEKKPEHKEDDEKKVEKVDKEAQNLDIKLPFNLIVNEASIIDGRITFTDLSLDEAFQGILDNINYKILAINLNQHKGGNHELGADSSFLENIDWQGKIEINPIKAYGTFTINELDLHDVSQTIQSSLNQNINSAILNASFSYYIKVSQKENIFRLENSSFELKNINIEDEENKMKILADKISFPNIDINAQLDQNQSGNLALKNIGISGLKFEQDESKVKFDDFSISNIDVQAKDFTKALQAQANINEISLANLAYSDKENKAALGKLALENINSDINKKDEKLEAETTLGKFSLDKINFAQKTMKANLASLLLENLSSKVQQEGEVLKADNNIKEIALTSANFSDKTMQAKNENLTLNNLDANLSKFKDDVNISSSLEDFSLNGSHFQDKTMQASLNDFSLKNTKVFLTKLKDLLTLHSNLDNLALNKINFKDKDLSSSISSIKLSSLSNELKQKDEIMNFSSSLGALTLQSLAFQDKEMKANFSALNLASLKAKVDQNKNFSTINSNIGTLGLNNLVFQDKNMNANFSSLNLQNSSNVLNLGKNSLALNSQLGKVQLNNLAYKDELFALKNNNINLGNIQAYLNQNPNKTNVNASLGTLGSQGTTLSVQNQKFLTLNAINLSQANYQDQNAVNLAKVGNVTLQGLNVFSGSQNFTSFSSLNVNQANFDIKKNALTVNSVTLSSLKAFVSLINDKILELENLPSFEAKKPASAATKPAPKPTAKPAPKPATKPTPAKPKSPDFTFKINEIGLKNSSITVKDNFSGKIVQNNISNINILVNNISSNFAQAFNVNASMNLDAKSKIATKGSVQIEPLNLNLSSNVNIANLGIFSSYAQKFANVAVKSGSLSLQSQTKYGKNMSVQADLALNNLNVFDTLNQETLATLGSLSVKKANLTDNSITIDTVNVNSPYFGIYRAFDGKFNFETLVKEQKKPAPKPAPKPSSPPPPKKEKPKKAPFAVDVNKVIINNGSAKFVDNSLKSGQVQVNVSKLQANVSNVAENKQSDILLNALIDKFGMLDLKAKSYLFDFEKASTLHLVLKSLGLSSFSPFTQDLLGYDITNGSVNVRADYNIKDSQISGKNYLNLDNVQMQEDKSATNITSIPINLALSLLKNRNNQIDFQVPVSGSLKDPNFKVFGTIMDTIGQIMTNIVLSPFRAVGNLFTSGDISDDKGIDFEVGSSTFPPSEVAKFEVMKADLAKLKNGKIIISPTYNQLMDTFMLRRAKYAQDLQNIVTKQRTTKANAMQILAKQRKVNLKSQNLEGDLILTYKASLSELNNLAQARALSIKNEFIKLGVNPNQIQIKSPSQSTHTNKKFVLSEVNITGK